jgi:hypothetical protein
MQNEFPANQKRSSWYTTTASESRQRLQNLPVESRLFLNPSRFIPFPLLREDCLESGSHDQPVWL